MNLIHGQTHDRDRWISILGKVLGYIVEPARLIRHPILPIIGIIRTRVEIGIIGWEQVVDRVLVAIDSVVFKIRSCGGDCW